MKNKYKLNKSSIVKLILILGLFLIIFERIFNINLGFFNINFGYVLIYLGVVFYFIFDGKPFTKSLDYIKKSKNYIGFSLIVFFIMGFIGYLFPTLFKEQILNLIKELIEKTEGLSGLELIKFIFINNLRSSFFAMILGIFLGIVPFTVILVNGYILGFVAKVTTNEIGFLVLWRLLPHGIFEIPAIMISVGIGIKLGLFLFVYKGKNRKKEFLKGLKDSLRVFIFVIIPLLMIAAIIEGGLIWLLG